jgi:hypothetical protein
MIYHVLNWMKAQGILATVDDYLALNYQARREAIGWS